jgi:tRNA(Ile2) C34 agmatinyltransferase TiaS
MRPMPPAPSQTTSEEEELERRVIAAFVHPEQGLLKALYRESASIEAVNASAVRLGLTTEVIRNSRLTGVLPEMRSCIQCDARFLSAGRHNRRCKRCLAR